MGFVSFTPMGRCGNFLFELAASFSYAKKHGMDFSIPKYTTDKFHNPIYRPHLADPRYFPGGPVVRIAEERHNYYELPFKEEWRHQNILLVGYFQSAKYIGEYRDDLLAALKYPWQCNTGWVSVHVRRGDYLVLMEKHPEVTKEWYDEAMSHFPGHNFMFFSDDIEWCVQEFGDRKNCFFSVGKNIEEDLVAMSMCQHHVNSSSTYSWWGAYLGRNTDKVVITPRLWFTEGWSGLNVDDIVPENWIKL
jgi:Glycosyl transferase family 11